jgi:hypothetical protein
MTDTRQKEHALEVVALAEIKRKVDKFPAISGRAARSTSGVEGTLQRRRSNGWNPMEYRNLGRSGVEVSVL